MARHKIGDQEIKEQIQEYRNKSLPEEALYPELTKDLAADLRIIRDMSELQHTCYIEICSGTKMKKSCWNKGALYFTVDGFEYLEPIIKDVYPDYSQYSFQCLGREDWLKIVEKMRNLSHALRSAEHKDDLGGYAQQFFYYRQLNPFDVAFDFTKTKLKTFIGDVIEALETELKENDKIYILGL